MGQIIIYRAETDEARAILQRISENADNAAAEDRLNGCLVGAMQNEALARALRLIAETKGGVTATSLRRQLTIEFRLRQDKLGEVMSRVYLRTKGVVEPQKTLPPKSRRSQAA